MSQRTRLTASRASSRSLSVSPPSPEWQPTSMELRRRDRPADGLPSLLTDDHLDMAVAWRCRRFGVADLGEEGVVGSRGPWVDRVQPERTG